MAYPDKLLADGEQVEEHLHPHWITLVPAVLGFVLVCAAGGVVAFFAPSSGRARTVVLVAALVVAALLVARLCLVPLARRASTHYVFTDRAVLLRRGVLTRTGHHVAYQRISDVGYTQSLLGRVVRAGTIVIESAGEHGATTLVNVPDPERVQQRLNELMEADAGRRSRDTYGPRRLYRGESPYPDG